MKIKDSETGRIFEILSVVKEFGKPIKTGNAGTIDANCGFFYKARGEKEDKLYLLKIKKRHLNSNKIVEGIKEIYIDNVESIT